MLVWLLVGGLMAGSVAAATLPFNDDFEDGLGNWSPGGAWGATTARYGSPGHAATDSPGSFYTNNTDAALALTVSLDLTSATRPGLSFQHSYALEANYDFGYIEASTDGGNTWLAPALKAYTGNLGAMSREQLDLSHYAGATDFRIRFRLTTDSSVVMDGWYVDDVHVAETPAAVTLWATQTNRNSVVLAWEQAAAPGFAGYRLYRSLTSGVDWHSARLVAEISGHATTSVTDIAVSPKTRYYYRLGVVNTDGMLTLGNECVVTTLPGMDYPFLDNGESGTATWIADTPWGLSDEDVISPTHCWSDSPGTNYANGITSQSLTLSAPLFLTGYATVPVLSFSHRYDFASGDSGNVEVSLNNGADWTSLASFTGSVSNVWRHARFSLADYTNAPSVLLRFRVTTDTSGQADGWHLDNISVAQSPAVVNAPVLDQVTSHTIRVSWPASNEPLFSHYAVLRSTAPGVGINSTLVTTLPDQNTTTFIDTNLALDTVYYYRIYAVNSYGAFSPDSLTESSARTLNNPLPFSDGFEGTLEGWNLAGSWGPATNEVHSGRACLSDSPGFNYTNSSDSYALTAVDLTGAVWPVLRFWDRYRLADNDWARLEVSTDGNSWTPLYGAAGIRTEWAEQTIDLSPYKNQSNLRIRFHVWTDGSTTEDGWSIDDLVVTEHTPAVIALPFYETFEAGLTNWLHSAWALDTNGAYGGSYAVRDTPTGRMNPDTTYWLGLGANLNLSNTVNPQLVFWLKGQLWYRSRFRVQYSTDAGLNWGDLYGLNYDWNQDWTRVQVSLQSLVNQTVRLRFATWNEYSSAPAQDLWIDNLALEEMPAAVTLETLTPGLRSVDLAWTASTLGAAFKRTEVYRATHATVTLSDTLIGTFTDPAATNLTDTGLSIGATYYYRVFTVDTNDVYSPSNERSTTTVPVPWPLADAMETTDQWVTTGTWGTGANGRNGGCLSDSPVGDYANSTDSYALSAVNLVGTTWPVLKFWDRYRLADNDWARLEVSTDGNSWTPLYGAAGIRTEWAEQTIDLSPYKNQSNLRIRFHVWTDGSTTEDGWSIDDLVVTEHTPAVIALPFYETFEAGLTNWLHSAWALDTNGAYGGSYAVRDTPTGRMNPDTTYWLGLGANLNLSNTVNPQLVFWLKGQLWYRSRFRVQYSTDAGLNWGDLYGLNYDWNQDWTRVQVSLQSLVNQTVRLRFATWNEYSSAPAQDLWIDNLALEESPLPVTLNPLDEITSATMRLNWTEAAIGNFKAYRVYRSESSGVSESSTLLAVFTNRAATTFTDSNLVARKTYYYRVYLYNQYDDGVGSNQSSATTAGVSMPWTANFETNQPGWTFTGTWTLWPGAGRNGSAGLVDSPGDYANSSSHYAQFAVDLRNNVWPVLRFWDRHIIANADWGRVFVSGDAGGSWTRVYGVSETRTNWAEQTVDLSPWKNNSQVWVRFQMDTDGGTQSDGWYLDDVSLGEHAPAPAAYPFYENFETGLDNWLHPVWTVDTNQPFAGQYAVRDTAFPWLPPDTQLALVLGRELNLTNAVNPVLTFRLGGQLWYRSRFRAQASTDGGIAWNDLITLNYDWSQDWTRFQAPLTSYLNRSIRLRFIVWSEYGSAPDQDLFLDEIGIGEPAPGAPTLAAPANLASVPIVRPTLSITNAVDYQGDPLSYRFEVYADAALSTLVAQVPVVAAGTAVSSWQVDTDLPNNAQYWWRCQASDGTNSGAWMTTATFFVNEINHPPAAPVVAGPPSGTLVTNLDALLFWFPSSGDPDEGDRVTTYQLQVAADPDFLATVINATNIPAVAVPPGTNWVLTLPLGALPGANDLVEGTLYHWRINAQDLRGLCSDWSAGVNTFQFGIAPPRPSTITAFRLNASGQVTLEWTGGAGQMYVEFSYTLSPPQWYELAGPLTGTSWTFTPLPNSQSGFYRVRSR